ncbi:hypothetical protein N657DRAFT_677841 [Parathielavia appendiculata]|uniref:Uncharacterized protein n=1 Tax=Parathielavia appendiculata TaxID=2587402 RepID=A0AAN6Z6P9_9PEZI|nr:hypothetical protein N657DRAFT_677841 [Parathielavia appendiculata]
MAFLKEDVVLIAEQPPLMATSRAHNKLIKAYERSIAKARICRLTPFAALRPRSTPVLSTKVFPRLLLAPEIYAARCEVINKLGRLDLAFITQLGFLADAMWRRHRQHVDFWRAFREVLLQQGTVFLHHVFVEIVNPESRSDDRNELFAQSWAELCGQQIRINLWNEGIDAADRWMFRIEVWEDEEGLEDMEEDAAHQILMSHLGFSPIFWLIRGWLDTG